MGATMTDEGGLKVVRLTGVLHKAELDAIQREGVQAASPESPAKVLVIAEGFEGWHRDDSWGDVSFVLTYGDRIDKMAFVAEPQWEDQLLMFAGAGIRRTPIKFFPLAQIEQARAWLAE